MLSIETTVIGEIDRIERRLAKLVAHFNERGEWEAGLRTQAAIVAVNNIHGADADLEEAYESSEGAK